MSASLPVDEVVVIGKVSLEPETSTLLAAIQSAPEPVTKSESIPSVPVSASSPPISSVSSPTAVPPVIAPAVPVFVPVVAPTPPPAAAVHVVAVAEEETREVSPQGRYVKLEDRLGSGAYKDV